MQKITWILFALCCCFASAQAQIGSTNSNPSVGSTVTYSYSGGIVVSPSWRLANNKGSLQSQSQSGSTYYATFLWNSSGAETIAFVDGNIPKATLNITILQPPPAPTATAATSITTTSFTANWSTVASATNYRVDVSTSNTFTSFVAQFTGVTTTNKNVTGLTTGSVYYYRVRSYNATSDLLSVYSNVITVQTSGPPPAPTLLAATSITETSFTINWAAIPNATSYRLDVSTSATFSPMLSGYNNLSVSGTSSPITGLAGGTVYYYRLRAVHSGGTSANSNSSDVLTKPASPVALPSTNVTSNSFTANWTSVTSAVSYQLDYSTSSTFNGFTSITGITGTSTTVSGLTSKTKYYYRVRATNPTGNSGYSNSVIGADFDQNYIRAMDVMVEGKTTTAQVESATLDEKVTKYTFYDGIGRPKQSVIMQGSPTQKDIIQPMSYDVFGRENKKYLPYTDENNGWYKSNALKEPNTSVTGEQAIYRTGKQYAFYQTGGVLASDQFPFAELRFEPSPLNRVVEQGSPGTDWQPDGTDSYTSSDHTSKVLYDVNAGSEVIQWTYVAATTNTPIRVVNAGYFPAGKLQKTRSKDEQQVGETIVFNDNEGRPVMKQVLAPNSQWAQTYYLYDAFGNLVVVLPPEAVKALTN